MFKEFAHENTWVERFTRYEQAIQRLFSESEKPIVPRPIPDVLPESHILQIQPASYRINHIFDNPDKVNIEIQLEGWGFTPDCVVLADEVPITTSFISADQLICQLPTSYCRNPGCVMISVIDQKNWGQSNRRVFLIEMV